MSTIGENIEALPSVGKTRGFWGTIQIWQWNTKDHPHPTTGEGLENTSDLREELYRYIPPEDAPILVLV